MTKDEERYVDIALKFPPDDLEVLAKIRDKMYKTMAGTIKSFADYLNKGGKLDIEVNSAYLIIDTFKISSVLYYQGYNNVILIDSAYDKLHKFVCDNVAWLKENKVIPDCIDESEITYSTGCGVRLKTNSDFILYKILSE
jgi:hypothetical protein